MSRLFIELYLDEDVSVLVADILRARGFVAVTTHEARRLGSSDIEQLGHATSERQTLLTHNRADFEALAQQYFHQGKRIRASLSPCDARRMKSSSVSITILNQVTADEMKNQLRYI